MATYTEKNSDALYGAKHDYQGYDVIVSNIVWHPYIIFLNLKLGKELVSADKVNILHKANSLFRLLYNISKDGISMSEG